jgi:hypothetical protein
LLPVHPCHPRDPWFRAQIRVYSFSFVIVSA